MWLEFLWVVCHCVSDYSWAHYIYLLCLVSTSIKWTLMMLPAAANENTSFLKCYEDKSVNRCHTLKSLQYIGNLSDLLLE